MESKHIYVADDEPALLGLMREVLENEGYRVSTAPDGPALLDMVRQEVPDLVLLDIMMPGMSGWEVQRALRAMPPMQGVPVVAVTAQGGAAVQGSALLSLGFSGFLRKPFPMAHLVMVAERALQSAPRPQVPTFDARPRRSPQGSPPTP